MAGCCCGWGNGLTRRREPRPQQDTDRAFAQLQRGEVDTARQLVAGVLRAYPRAAPALHLMALVESEGPDPTAALPAFRAALAASPQDPQVHNNLGNLYHKLRRFDEAVAAYDAALRLQPTFADALMNKGIALQSAGRLEEALPLLQKAATLAPNMAAAWTAMGLCFRELGMHDSAAGTLDHALQLQPGSPRALLARAMVESERGGHQAVGFYERALAAKPGDPAAMLGTALARHQAGDSAGAVSLLEAAVARAPDWCEGHEALAKLRWQAGAAEAFVDSYRQALAAAPANVRLWLSLLSTLSQAGDHAQVRRLAAEARTAAGAHPSFDLAEGAAASETGDLAAAEAALARFEGDAARDLDVALVLTRHALRRGEPERAERLLAGWRERENAHQLVWAQSLTAWRMMDDPRQHWLVDVDTMCRLVPIALDAYELGAVADTLRALHVAREHPFEQTLRGGTQTTGSLFLRTDHNITRLRLAIEEAIRVYLDGLPPPREGHPLLGRPRGAFRFAGSWSVRLRGAGHHVNHAHPAGWLSSACYIALPAEMGGEARAGWLTLGEPPEELRTGLSALGMIEPREGHVALFPSYLWHGTRPFGAGERLTVAFDAVPL